MYVTDSFKKMFRFHVLSLPHTVTTVEYSACAFTQKVLKFCKMMHLRGHTVIHYGHRDSIVDCTEHVPVMDDETLLQSYGSYDWKKVSFKHNTADLAHKVFNKRAAEAVRIRKQKGDFLLAFWNSGHKDIIDAHKDLFCVEPGIGCFNNLVTPYAVFESYAVMHYVYGKYNISPRWFDCVIPNYFDTSDFSVDEVRLPLNDIDESKNDTNQIINQLKSGYILFVGRIISTKGVSVIIDTLKELSEDYRLVFAGQENVASVVSNIPENIKSRITEIGYVVPYQRKALMSKCRCVMMPTYYVEPFGGVNVEAQLSGKPVITSDWGVFPETVIQNVTGYRCRTIEQFVWAVKNCDKLNTTQIAEIAKANYSLERVAEMYEEYFTMVSTVSKQGFYEKNDSRDNLNWLCKRTF